MNTWSASLFTLFVIFLFTQPEASGFALRAPTAPTSAFDALEIRKITLQNLPVVPADPSCRVRQVQELYPEFRGNYAQPRRARVWPITIMEAWGVPRRFSSGVLEFPSDYTCDQARSGDCGNLAYDRFFSVNGVNLEESALRGYCHRAHPSSLEDVFAAGFDFPADFITLWTTGYLTYRWTGTDNLRRLQTQFPDQDLFSLYELNLRAANLWQSLLACTGGNAELARRMYFEANFRCHSGQPSGEQIRNALAEYLRDVKDYYQSAYFRPPVLNMSTQATLAMALELGHPVAVSELRPLPSLHPLFSQATLQLLAEIIPLDRSISLERFDREIRDHTRGFDYRLLIVLTQFTQFAPGPEGAHHYGLWPSAARATIAYVNFRRLEMLLDFARGGNRAVWLGGIHTKIDHRRLPDIYGANSEQARAIALELRNIGRRYFQTGVAGR